MEKIFYMDNLPLTMSQFFVTADYRTGQKLLDVQGQTKPLENILFENQPYVFGPKSFPILQIMLSSQ